MGVWKLDKKYLFCGQKCPVFVGPHRYLWPSSKQILFRHQGIRLKIENKALSQTWGILFSLWSKWWLGELSHRRSTNEYFSWFYYIQQIPMIFSKCWTMSSIHETWIKLALFNERIIKDQVIEIPGKADEKMSLCKFSFFSSF